MKPMPNKKPPNPKVLKLLDSIAARKNEDGSFSSANKTFRKVEATSDGKGVELWMGEHQQSPNYRIYNPPSDDYEAEGKDPADIIGDILKGRGH